MNSAEGLKDEEAGILNKVLQASNKEEVIHQNLKDRKHVNLKIFRSVYRATSNFNLQQFKV